MRTLAEVFRIARLEDLEYRSFQVNQGAMFVRVLASDSAIWVSADVFAYPLVPRHVFHACGVVADMASELRGKLESEFGQRTLFPKVASGGLKN